MFRIDPEGLAHAAARFGSARDRSDATISYLKNAAPAASAFGTTSTAAQLVSEVMNVRERQLGAHASARELHESAQARLQTVRMMADHLVADTTAVAAAYPSCSADPG